MERAGDVVVRVNSEAKDFRFVIALGVLAALSLMTVFYLYRIHFSGAFSMEADDWSDFGGYFGGVLGPIVSVLTLLTVFKTVFLQREMIKLQDATFRSQIQQAKSLAADAIQSRLDYRKSVLMGVIDKVEWSITKEMDSTRKACFETIKVMNSLTNVEQVQSLAEGVKELQQQIEVLDDMRVSLQRLMFDLSMRPYDSIEDLDSEFRERMRKIRPDFNKSNESN